MDRKACLKVYGHVQGVFYRNSARNKALELGVNGFVENLTDGGVYIEAEGPEESLKAFIEWCHHGPETAQVDRVEVEYREKKGFNSFQIRY